MNKTKGCLIANFATVPVLLPGRLLDAAHEALFRALDSSTGGNF
uniref:Uncharacterized protein n=1 Tax=Klebsiella pneumoniae TaxID=573 RepID=A0A330L414_KLEPN|nr:hypothetical protein PCNR341_0100 [Klebsiella pneumoniae]